MSTTSSRPSERSKAAAARIKELCPLIASFGFAWVEATFDGAGDSGDMDNFCLLPRKPIAITDEMPETSRAVAEAVRVFNDDNSETFEDFKNECVKNAATPEQATALRQQLDRFEQAVWELLPSGWEINEGSYGSIAIDVAAKTLQCTVHTRISDIETDIYDY